MKQTSKKWYAAVTRYQWLVLTVASLGWIFDAFEGQIYNITRFEMLPDLLGVSANAPIVKIWGERFLESFLLVGRLEAGSLAHLLIAGEETQSWPLQYFFIHSFPV